ncbi:MAG: hypothetical protein MHPSP_000318 [Paramarteilia canceri]
MTKFRIQKNNFFNYGNPKLLTAQPPHRNNKYLSNINPQINTPLDPQQFGHTMQLGLDPNCTNAPIYNNLQSPMNWSRQQNMLTSGIRYDLANQNYVEKPPFNHHPFF